MEMHRPPTPSLSSDDGRRSELSRYSTQTPSPIHVDFLEQQPPVYDYLGPDVEDPFRDVPDYNYGNSLEPCLPSGSGRQLRDRRAHLLTPSATPRSSSTSASQAARSPSRRPTSRPAKKGSFELTAPLSELTKHMTHVPLRDMEAHANRPLEVRLQEVEKKGGKIARPMNSFLLYRSAYAERTKEWCSKNNHQIVSRVSGASWPHETKEIREKYEQLAIIERENHRKAHPDYKFTPNKNAAMKRKRSADFSEGSAFEGFTDEYGYLHAARAHHMPTHRRVRTSPYPMSAQYPSSLHYGNNYGTLTPMEPWVSTSSSPAMDHYQQAMLRSQMERSMTRNDPYSMNQWAGQELSYTPSLTPSVHRQTLEAPIQNSGHLSASFMSMVDPQLLEASEESTFNGSMGNAKQMDPVLLSYSQAPGPQMSPAPSTFTELLQSPHGHTYRASEDLKFDYSSMSFAPDPFPVE